jgi:hypothetical protein
VLVPVLVLVACQGLGDLREVEDKVPALEEVVGPRGRTTCRDESLPDLPVTESVLPTVSLFSDDLTETHSDSPDSVWALPLTV